MGSDAPRDIRVFCECGQKMRVIPEAESRPGKCVACHRKFWTPRRDELPADAGEVRLSEHPEWMRAAGERTRAATPAAEESPSAARPGTPVRRDQAEAPEKPAGGRDAALRSEVADRARADASLPDVPLDILEPLRRVASCVELVGQRMREAPESGEDRSGPDRATLESYLRILGSIRERHDQRLKAALFDTTERLVALLEGIAMATLKFRTGELPYDEFYSAVWEFRARREALERHRQNLRGWLNCRDTRSLGGPVAVTLDDIDLESSDLELKPPAAVTDPLIPHHAGKLAEALEGLSRAARKLRECRRMEAGATESPAALAAAEQEAATELERARTEEAFRRARLAELLKDFDADRAAIEARLQLPTDQTDEGAARELRRALDDMRRLRGWIRAALDAESAADLPLAQPTLFRRLDSKQAFAEVAVEALPAYLSALLLLVLSVPLFSTAPGGGGYTPSGAAALAALAMAFAAAVIPALRDRAMRGAALAGLLAAQGLVWGADMGTAAGGSEVLSLWSFGALLAWGANGAALAGVWWAARPRAFGLALAVSVVLCAGAYPAGGLAPAPKPQPPSLPVARVESPPAPASAAPPAASPEAPVVTPVTTRPAVPAPPAAAPAVPETAETAPQPAEEPVEKAPADPGNAPAPAVADPAPLAEMTLKGVFHKEGDPPRFRITLTLPSGRIKEIDGELGDVIHNGWKAAEYNSSMQKLTLSSGERLLVVQPGETVELP